MRINVEWEKWVQTRGWYGVGIGKMGPVSTAWYCYCQLTKGCRRGRMKVNAKTHRQQASRSFRHVSFSFSLCLSRFHCLPRFRDKQTHITNTWKDREREWKTNHMEEGKI